MARMPGARWRGEHGSTPMDRYDIVCVHTIVGYAPADAAHFSIYADGRIDQSRDTRYRSAANLDGNHRVIAIENEDHGPAFGGAPKLPAWVPLTEAQVDACARILAWAHQVHDVPLQLCPDSRPGSRGLAYHRQGIDGAFGPGTAYPNPGRVPGGEVWTSSPGKVCPTDVRIDQLPEILRRAQALVAEQEDPMAAYAEQLTEIIQKLDDVLSKVAVLEKARVNTLERDRKLAKKLRELRARVAAGDRAAAAKLDQVLAELEEDPQ